MDNFINLGKQYLESQSKPNRESPKPSGGGPDWGSFDSRHQGSQGGQGDYGRGEYGHGSPNPGNYRPSFDEDEVVRTASREGSGDRDLFATALSFLNKNSNEKERPVDEQHITSAHERAYGQGNTGGMSANSLGSAAAMQVFKQFVSGGGGNQQQKPTDSKTTLISLAMAEASKLFDKSSNTQGNKQDAVNGAAMTVMKLLVQSKFSSGGTTGGQDSGGLGSLIGLASKFM